MARSMVRRISPSSTVDELGQDHTAAVQGDTHRMVGADPLGRRHCLVDARFRPTAMIAVQTVLVENYWAELSSGLTSRGLPILHVVLDCDEAELRQRIENDEAESQALEWRLDHLTKFEAARPWLTRSADLVLDTTDITPESGAEAIVEAAARARSEPGGRVDRGDTRPARRARR